MLDGIPLFASSTSNKLFPLSCLLASSLRLRDSSISWCAFAHSSLFASFLGTSWPTDESTVPAEMNPEDMSIPINSRELSGDMKKLMGYRIAFVTASE
jgi:hypothetical protein